MPIHRSLAIDPGPAPLRRLADQIETLRHEDRPPAILRACLELGGTVSRPGDGTHFFEIMLLGAYARGADLVEAARNWLAVARNLAPSEPAPPSAGDFSRFTTSRISPVPHWASRPCVFLKPKATRCSPPPPAS